MNNYGSRLNVFEATSFPGFSPTRPYGARERVGTRLFLKLSPILPRKFNEAGAAFLKGLHPVLKELTSPVQSGVEFTSVVRDWPISNFRCYSRLKRR